MFSAILTSRVQGNGDSNLPHLLDSIKRYSDDASQFEVLIKFDTDDQFAPELIRTFKNYPFAIKHIIDRRGRGAMDMHLGYTTLLPIANSASEFFITLSDDFEVKKGWDTTLLSGILWKGEPNTPTENWVLERLDGMQDVFFIQYMRHPGATDENKFNMSWDANNIESTTGLEIAPAFSKKLIQLVGGFGHVSFTDAWAALLQHELWNRHDINITKFTSKEYVVRMPQGEGMEILEQANRDGQRTHNFKLINTKWYREIISVQAQVIADYHRNYRENLLRINRERKQMEIIRESKIKNG